MRAVWLVLVAGFRRQWRSWVLLGLLIAVASGFVLASTAAGRRTDAAFPRYVASHGYDAIVYTVQPLPKGLPGVAHVTPMQMPFYDQPLCSCHRRISTGSFSVREVPPASLGRVAKLVAGRMPDPSSPVEALASFTLQRDYGVGLGTVITLPMAGASQRQAIFRALAGEGPPPKKATGPRMAMRVVGIVAAENEFSYGQGVTYTLYPGPGFAAATKGSPALTSYYVRLRHGQADFARFEAKTNSLAGTGVQDLDRPAATITASIHPQAVGWRVLAALAALAAVAVVGQALARQASAESADHPVLSTLGLSPRLLAVRIMLRTLIVAVAGAAGGIAVATLLSPLAPLGEARLAEPAPGLSFDAVNARPGRTGDGGRGDGAGRATGAACGPGAHRGRPHAGHPPVGGRGCRRGGGRAARRGHRHPARPGTGPRHPRGPGGNGADRFGGRGGGVVRDRGLRQQPGPPDHDSRPLRCPLPGLLQQRGTWRRRPGPADQRARKRPGHRPDHPRLAASGHRQPGQRPGHRRDRRPRPNAAVGR